MTDSPIIGIAELGSPPWQTLDPFLFCVHHRDRYPRGNDAMGPEASLAGRQIGSDFAGKDGWSMYHGDVVPGFPRHPHCGFETITIARSGYIDHADSLGAEARFGNGDVQWMTAGRGVEHSEMFPLVNREDENPTELFQIWLNLPRASKKAAPHFTMLWSENVPRIEETNDAGATATIAVVAGRYGEHEPPAPPPDSWAADDASHVAVWTARLEAGARWTLPAGPDEAARVLYFFEGSRATIAGQEVPAGRAIQLRPGDEVVVTNGDTFAEMLLLQGRPIGEPVVQHGPFVVNQPEEVREAIRDYQRGEFGKWPHDRNDPVHPRDATRFAIHVDGREERPPGS